ncbi:MAG: ribonuclease PH [Magnetococcales bacterium]|nr:ribonuclease PH [Magnetococcales bacterium]
MPSSLIPRSYGRLPDALRPVTLQRGFNCHAEGSCLVQFGQTQVLCTASVEENLPSWLRGQERGWLTAEYGMLPRATKERTPREASRGKQGGRTLEIQRLIGRALRSVVDFSALGKRTIHIDCDVIQADGGTRTAAITGGFVALADACRYLQQRQLLAASPLRDAVAAVSCCLVADQPLLDPDYQEDSRCDVDMNFVMTGAGLFVELQGTAEGQPFSRQQFEQMAALAQQGIQQLLALQQQALA